MGIINRLKQRLESLQSSENFRYLEQLSDEKLKALSIDGESKAQKHAAQQELLKRALRQT
ncbi:MULTISPECIES: hypothetical protein [Vibrio]|uniref:Uncharacterized protein n=1 Tax=Vibrio casei TaxID=673372 RepID=A0A368LGU5_9VIBR|nr:MULTISPECIES: hypothetical protein [Vibrio]RCS69253.1 hypothetical protein CIK83_16825 [Vibrio casei]SJN38136.1 hypothetical protein FM109_15395 [Vibrio casei]HBV76216.1 hypothetical protein [Vibrio sp.]